MDDDRNKCFCSAAAKMFRRDFGRSDCDRRRSRFEICHRLSLGVVIVIVIFIVAMQAENTITTRRNNPIKISTVYNNQKAIGGGGREVDQSEGELDDAGGSDGRDHFIGNVVNTT